MTVETLIVLDLLAGVAATAGWLGAGATAARRAGVALALAAVALVATLARCATTFGLAGAGWWFAQEKITLTLPIAVAAALAAGSIAGPRLLATVRGRRPSPAPDAAVLVPLFGAGYAAAAGPAVTLLAGYPATASTVLVTLALVAGAVLTTWRVVAGSLPGARAATATVLAAAVAGTGLAFVPAETTDAGGGTAASLSHHGATSLADELTASPSHDGMAASLSRGGAAARGAQDGHTSGRSPVSADAVAEVPVTSLRGPSTPEPGGTVRRYDLAARTATIRLASGKQVEAWTFNGRVPGPPITAVQGDLIEVRLRNDDIASGVTLHWHGYDVPSGEDGVPGLTQDAVMPGQEFVYRFRALQAGTYWYHTHEVSDLGVRMGLYGTLIVSPRPTGEAATGTPGATDKKDPSGATMSSQAGASGELDLVLPVHTFAGTTVLGDQDRPIERAAEPGAPVRLRLINTDNTPRRFALTGTTYQVAAIDGRNLNQPGPLDRALLRLPAGGRYDLVFPMPSATVVLLVDGRPGLRLGPGATPGAAMSVADTSGWPEFDPLTYGRPAATPFTASSRFDRDFDLVLDRGLAITDGRPAYAHTANGRAFPSIPTETVREGDLVRLTVVNRSRETHPWHLHGHTVLVLSRDGRRPAGAPLWLDTFDVQPGQVWEVAFRAGNPGLWMNHCHNLSHADLGMALHLAYDGVTSPFHGAHGG
ncbi:hypothetical protein Ssi03_54190 [Sphaerisporangium siamense]|uniref:FtsP/CotA-like multicopper oxidase with cupredoxin domain n=1 Tax=Sphaerisporangium siamense TaxID=795645 RepID=A0A7W7D6I7_9ACTN|nr:multicopper oxidase family protein [Sphaerisporangium siamense]MBB4701203.1 FtsP/CotA-like multicopper oxidase with cupredoxin domain [Sphaerisporangium siamense]GII87429.1 hypothetical protein Ssi03_54190 [Sphaerisporangium siamense]